MTIERVEVKCALYHVEWNYVTRYNPYINIKHSKVEPKQILVGEYNLDSYEFDGTILNEGVNIFINNEVGYRPIHTVKIKDEVLTYEVNYYIVKDIEGKNRRTTAVEEWFTSEYPNLTLFSELEIHNPNINENVETDLYFKLDTPSYVLEVDDFKLNTEYKSKIPNWLVPILLLSSVLACILGIIIGNYMSGWVVG